jgi:hypothetical protein
VRSLRRIEKTPMILAALKSAFSPGNVVKTLITMGAVFLILDVLGYTGYLVNPWSTWLSGFFRKSS